MSDGVDIKVSEELIRPIIEAKIHAAITESLDTRIVEKVVSAAMSAKVGRDGKYDSGYGSVEFLQWLCEDAIRQAAAAAMKRWAEERKEQLEAEFLRQLRTKKTSSLVVKACISGLTDATTSRWGFSVNIGEKVK